MLIRLYCLTLIVTLFVCSAFQSALAKPDLIPPKTDPHYTDVGFFDIHVCNWPNRPLFFLILFSTTHFNNIKSIEILTNENKHIGFLDLEKYRLSLTKEKKEKRAFLKQFEIPEGATNGWYNAIVTTRDGKKYASKDFVVLHEMERASDRKPPANAEDLPLIKELAWKPVPGAKHYKVFIRDLWEGKLIYESKVLNEARLKLPDNLLKPGGLYSWQIHSRDVNENILLGDFNHGSLTGHIKFSIAGE